VQQRSGSWRYSSDLLALESEYRAKSTAMHRPPASGGFKQF
jgi:hypothetical protein